jgi:hypothetical protein
MRDLKAGDVLLDENHQPWIRVTTATRNKKDAVVVVRGEALKDSTDGWTSGHSMTNVNILRGE